eukprot:745921-Hanusia_phi.AAC.3
MDDRFSFSGGFRRSPIPINAFGHVIFVASRLHLLTLPLLRQWRWGWSWRHAFPPPDAASAAALRTAVGWDGRAAFAELGLSTAVSDAGIEDRTSAEGEFRWRLGVFRVI